jgi:uncharacterized membrane protein YfcA
VLALASMAVAVGGVVSYHYYPAIIAALITCLLVWVIVATLVERRNESSAPRAKGRFP